MRHICILCAIHQEIRPILHRFPSHERSRTGDCPTWRFQAFGADVTLMQSGMGTNNASHAASAAATLNPAMIINAGFCGALSAGIAIGDVFLAEKLYRFSAGTIQGSITLDHLPPLCSGTKLKRGTFITADAITDKASITCQLPDESAANLLEMESASVAAVCHDHGISFIAVRSVSDTADQDPGNLLRSICDSTLDIRAANIALSLFKRPAVVSEYVQLSRNAAIAGKALSGAVGLLLESV